MLPLLLGLAAFVVGAAFHYAWWSGSPKSDRILWVLVLAGVVTALWITHWASGNAP